MSLPTHSIKEEEEDIHENNNNKATILSSALNLSNTIVGAGMLGLPGAFAGTGYLTGTILLFLSCYFSTQGLMLLSRSAVKANVYPSSFYTVAHAAVPQYTILIDAAVSLKCFGVATGYLITVGDCMVEAFALLLSTYENDDSTLHPMLVSRKTWVTFALLAVLPVSFFHQFHKLKFASATALIFVFGLTAGIVAYAHHLLGDPCAGSQEECRGIIESVTTVPTTISKLPIFIFAFTCQQNIFPVVNELRNRTMPRLDHTVAIATLFALAVFYIVSIEGYATFGSNVKGDILLNYPENKVVTVMRICIAFMLTLHYPLQLDPSRRCILSLMGEVKRRWGRRTIEEEGEDFDTSECLNLVSDKASYAAVQVTAADVDTNHSKEAKEEKKSSNSIADDDSISFYIVTYIFLLSSYILAMVVTDLGVILALVGATGSTLVSYVLPGLIYVKLFREDELWTYWKMMAFVQLILGCILMPVALYFVLRGASAH